MIRASSSPRPALRRLAFTIMSITLIACTQDRPGEEAIRIQPISVESSLPLFNAGRDQEKGSSQRLLLGFDSSPFYSSATYGFYRLGDNLYYAQDQGHRKTGSVGVRNRTATWQGPLLTLPPLEKKSYTASVWVKLINTERTADVKLILMQVSDNDIVSLPLAEIEASPRAWQKIEGRFAGAKSQNHMHALRVEVDGVDIDYLIDDVLIEETTLHSELEAELELKAFAESVPTNALISNGGFEEGLEPWSYQGGRISRSKRQAHAGEYSLLVDQRTLEWHAPVMVIKELQDNTLYRFRIFVRLTEDFPAETVQLTLRQIIDGRPVFTALANESVTSNGWTEVVGSISAPNFSLSEQTSVYLECGNPVASYYVDSFTVEEI